eukprot:IDg11374t1
MNIATARVVDACSAIGAMFRTRLIILSALQFILFLPGPITSSCIHRPAQLSLALSWCISFSSTQGALSMRQELCSGTDTQSGIICIQDKPVLCSKLLPFKDHIEYFVVYSLFGDCCKIKGAFPTRNLPIRSTIRKAMIKNFVADIVLYKYYIFERCDVACSMKIAKPDGETMLLCKQRLNVAACERAESVCSLDVATAPEDALTQSGFDFEARAH